MNITFKKPLIAALTSAFFLAGCGSATSSLPNAEKTVHESNEKSTKIVLDLAALINIADDNTANYEQIADQAGDATAELKKLEKVIEKADISNINVTPVKQNTVVQTNAAARLTAKVEELAKKAKNEDPNSSEMSQITSQLNGLKSRLENAATKFIDLNHDLSDAVNKPASEPDEEPEAPETQAPADVAAEATI